MSGPPGSAWVTAHAETGDAAVPVAFYRRVSNDELKERGTIENQRQYLQRKYEVDLAPDSPQPLRLVGDFADDGISGAIPLRDRPEGQRLLELCRAGAIKLIIVTKLDRLGLTARVLLDAHDELAHYGVAIASATEPFDTRTSIGRRVSVAGQYRRARARDDPRTSDARS